jgi:hypothetical protein
MSKPNVLWRPNSDWQVSFLSSSARTALAGGGGGGGKTSALLAAAAAQTGNPRSRGVIFRRDYPSLRHIISASYELFLPMRAAYNKQEHTWRFPGRSTIEFSHLEDDAAVYQHAGKEYSFLGFDELQQLPEDGQDSRGQPINSAFQFLQSRLRAARDSGLRLECRCTATPDGPGLNWIRDYFRIPDSGESTEFVDPVSGYRRAYFRSVLTDNPACDPDYIRGLLDQPEARRRALIGGDWTCPTGQVFTSWNYRDHTCEEAFAIPAEWPLWRGADDGFASPACVLWLAYDEIHDRIFVIAELYARGMSPAVMAREVRRIDASIPRNVGHGRVIENGPAVRVSGSIDSASFATTGASALSRGAQMNELGCNWKPCTKGAGSRIAGIQEIHSRLSMKEDGMPGLVIFRDCRALIRTLPSLVYDPRNPEDIDAKCEDHAFDACRYGLQFRPPRAGRARVVF